MNTLQATLKPIMTEVGTGDPGYRWVQRYLVVSPDGKNEYYPGMTLKEAREFAKSKGWTLAAKGVAS